MDAVELARQIAADLHHQAVANGHDPWRPYEFAIAERCGAAGPAEGVGRDHGSGAGEGFPLRTQSDEFIRSVHWAD